MNNYSITHSDMSREVFVNNGDGTGIKTIFNPDGTTASEENITGLSVFSYPPLDSAGALATLLVVLELVPLADASNAIGEEPDHLIAEAEAWSVASQ